MPSYFDKEGNFLRQRFDHDLKDANISQSRDGYRLDFVGRDYARLQSGLASETMLVPDSKHNAAAENSDSGNLFFTGDNLETLRHLANAYAGKVKMIYIDPPYNTGQEFVYSDHFEWSDAQLQERLGYSDAEIKRLHSISGKASHSAWLTFMYPRLKIARRLLRDDGVIFISIDDNEQANLRLLMDEIFGENNFVGQIVWQKKYAATNDSKGFSTTHDYVVVYQKSYSFERNLLPRTEEQNKPYKNDDGDGKGLWRSDNLLVKSFSPSGVYPIVNPNTGDEYYPPDGSCWRASSSTMEKWLKENRIFFGIDGKGAPQLKRYLNEVQQGRVPITWWPFEEVGHNDAANKELAYLFGHKTPFDTPKPTSLIKQMMIIATKPEGIILDFFAGSGTTAHAVMELNAEDGGDRKWILCQLDEPVKEGSEAAQAGYASIDQIARERISRAARKVREANPLFAGHLGFKHYFVREADAKLITEIEEFDPTLPLQQDMFEGLANKLGVESILTTWLTADGFPLTEEVTLLDIAGYKAHYIDNSLLYIISEGWETDQTKALCNLVGERKLNLNTIIIFGYSLGFEAMRELEINVKQSLNGEVLIEKRY